MLIRCYVLFIIPLLVCSAWYVVAWCDMFHVPRHVEAITRQCLIALCLSILCDRIRQACSRNKGYRLALVVMLVAIVLCMLMQVARTLLLIPSNVALPIP